VLDRSLCVSGVIQIRTGKHSDFIDIVELAKVFAVEAGPKVCDENLGALVQTDSLSIENGFVTEAVKILSDKVDKAGGRVVGAVDAVCKASSELLEMMSQYTDTQWTRCLCLHCRVHRQPHASTVFAL
jgi:hypothetical protein